MQREPKCISISMVDKQAASEKLTYLVENQVKKILSPVNDTLSIDTSGKVFCLVAPEVSLSRVA